MLAFLPSKGVEDMPPQNMLLWHTDYLELKALKKQQMQEGLSDLPLFTLKQAVKFHMRKVASYTRKRRTSYPQRLGINAEMTCTHQPTKITLTFHYSRPLPQQSSSSLPHNLLP